MRVRNALAILNPEFLEIIDESDKHQGHSGHQIDILTHVHIRIGADIFKNMTRIQRHKAVTTALAAEINDFLHAIRITITGC